MKPVESTAEIIAYKALNRDIDKSWVDWAYNMLVAGFDTESLEILAGESEPFNQFQLQDLTNKVFDELNLDYLDKDLALNNYVCYLVTKSLLNKEEVDNALRIIKDICIELDYKKSLFDFYLLFFAKADLAETDNQYYWDGADKNNIEKIIEEHFINWKNRFEQLSP